MVASGMVLGMVTRVSDLVNSHNENYRDSDYPPNLFDLCDYNDITYLRYQISSGGLSI